MARRKKKPEAHANHERWLVSYADFITLLFAVFVTLFAMSQTDKRKVEEVIASLRESFGYAKSSPMSKVNVLDSTELTQIPSITPPASRGPMSPQMPFSKNNRQQRHADEKDFKQAKTSLEAYLIKNGVQDKVHLEINRRGLVISLKEAGFFDSGSAEIKVSSYPLLAKIAESLSEYSNQIRVEGHTDNIPINTHAFPSNWELSTARATNIVRHLLTYYRFDAEKLSATGYAEFRAVADNGTSEGRSKNRRVDIVLMSGDGERNEPSTI
ncbi:MAG: flagellar basal body stator protein MotB [Deltaproteobacteria bacterium]|nr:flagellar basal body stator protein MotB [Deltaproteobacteria bacterium]